MGKTKTYYEMNEQQFKEMKKFYQKLGYDESQVKKLTKQCFGAEIRINKNAPYSESWNFWRRIETPPLEKLGAAIRANAGAKACGSGAMPEAMVELEDCCAMPEPMELMRAAAPGMAAAPMMMGMPGGAIPTPVPAEEFHTAETHDAKENEEHSPLDCPQMIFSANVNTASWSYVRNMISKGRIIDPSFVRMEEILNSYPYQLKKPDKELFEISAEKGDCPWNQEKEVLFVGLKARKSDKQVKQNLAFLVDVSGSMDDEWVLVQMSMASIISKLKKGDTMSIIAYSDDTTTVVKQMDCGNPDDCVKAVLKIDGIGGCTNGSDGLENAYRYLEENFDQEANNRVFIFTDGDFNFGLTSEGSLKDFIYEKRKTGIYLSVVGYGEHNFKDNKMETLARNGNGNYTFIANPRDILDQLHKKLVANLVTIAKDVKISVELNPRYVKEYRLLGYDDRALTQQEFHDTEKATDGIGSGHNVVAMIELRRGEAVQRYAGRYVNAETSGEQEEFAFVEVHYKSPEGENLVMTKVITLEELEKTPVQNVPIASMLAVFGLLVKGSEYKGAANKEMLSKLLERFEEDPEYKTNKKYSHFDIIRKYLA